MEFASLVQKALAQDGRNRFAKFDDPLPFVPEIMLPFYRQFNPEDVEVEINEAIVRLIPAAELESVKKEYPEISDQFIFATSNSDPIFLHEGAVYVIPHGVPHPEWEKLADSLDDYLSGI